MKSITPIEVAERLNFKVLNKGNGTERRVSSIYCCDLLSIVMGRAPNDCAWVTVMGNINAVAVCALSDATCIVMSEGMTLDKEGLSKAIEEDICVLSSDLPTFEVACAINELLAKEE